MCQLPGYTGAMPSDPWLDDRQQQIWRQWLQANARLTAALGRQLSQDSGTSLSDFEVLVHLSESAGGRVRIVALADALQWERSRLSHHLTRMEKRGLVARQDCQEDARGAYAVLTEQGRELIEQIAPGHARAVRHLFFDELTDDDLDALDRVTSGLLARLDLL
jgi:DNA-binding MarR family transcriptional regulator